MTRPGSGGERTQNRLRIEFCPTSAVLCAGDWLFSYLQYSLATGKKIRIVTRGIPGTCRTGRANREVGFAWTDREDEGQQRRGAGMRASLPWTRGSAQRQVGPRIPSSRLSAA